MDFLDELQKKSVERIPDFNHGSIDDWSILEWAGAMAGEAGEFANVAKKIRRGDFHFDMGSANAELAKEAADVVCYLVIACAQRDINLRHAIIQKFNQVSADLGSTVELEVPGDMVYYKYDDPF